MENSIKAIIKADLEAQAKVEDAQNKVNLALSSLSKDREAVHREVFEKARTEVEEERSRLQEQLSQAQQAGETVFQSSIVQLETIYNAREAEWLETLFERTIKFEDSDE